MITSWCWRLTPTVNTRLEKFVGKVMELEVGEKGYVVVNRDDVNAFDDGGIDVDGVSTMGGLIPILW